MRSRTVSLALAFAMAATAAAAIALSALPASAWLLLPAAGAAGAAWERGGWRRIPPLALTLAGGAGFLASFLPLSRETLAEQSLTALGFLLAVKLLGEKRRRDHLQIIAVSLLLVTGCASLAPDLAFAALLALTLALGVSYLLWLPFSEIAPTVDRALLRRLAALAGLLVAGSLPVALGLFVALPRSVNPFWSGLGGRPRQGVTGVSDDLRLGAVSRIALSGDLAFRADLEGFPGPLPGVPYWRGAVLELAEPGRWSAVPRLRPPASQPPGTPLHVTYYVEPHGERQLFLLDVPASATVGARQLAIGANRVLRLPLPLARRRSSEGVSLPGDRFPEPLAAQERALDLQLPRTLPASVRRLAAELAAGQPDPPAVARRVVGHFASGYTYSVEVPPDAGDPLEAFLFRHRTGYCEYFASATATLLRAAGVPARVVTGYLGGEYVAAGNYYRVTQASAHAWVEAWLGDEGWVRLDPTPAGEAGATWAARRAARPLLWLDAARMRWNAWVVQYDAESQLALARSGAARLRALRIRPSALIRPAAVAALLAVVAAAALRLPRRRRAAPLARRAARFQALAARSGAAREPHEGPLDHAARFAGARPAARAPILRFAAVHAACRYGGRVPDPAALAELDALLARIRAAR